jgi:hypothetical protein
LLEIIAAFWSLFFFSSFLLFSFFQCSTHLSGRLAEEKLGTWLLPSHRQIPLYRELASFVSHLYLDLWRNSVESFSLPEIGITGNTAHPAELLSDRAPRISQASS